MGTALAMFAAAMFGLSAVLVRRGQQKTDADRGLVLSTGANVVFNGLAVLLRWAWTGDLGFDWGGLGFFILGGLLTTLTGRWLWFLSIGRIGPARAGAFKVSQPVFTLAFAAWVLGDRVDLVAVAGVAVTVTGLYLLSVESVGSDRAPVAAGLETQPGGPGPLGSGAPAAEAAALRAAAPGIAGVALGVASAVSFAAGNISRKAGVTRWPEPVVGAFVGALVACAGFLAAGAAQGRLRQVLRWRWEPGVADFLWVGLATSFAQFSFFGSLRLSPVWVANTIGALEPLFAMAVSPWLLGRSETWTRRSLASVGLACAGVAILSMR